MPKDERERVAVGDARSKGRHGGNRGGGKEHEPERSDPKAGQDPNRGGRPAKAAAPKNRSGR